MELKDAKEILNQAIDAALKSGVYNLEDVKIILAALNSIKEI